MLYSLFITGNCSHIYSEEEFAFYLYNDPHRWWNDLRILLECGRS